MSFLNGWKITQQPETSMSSQAVNPNPFPKPLTTFDMSDFEKNTRR